MKFMRITIIVVVLFSLHTLLYSENDDSSFFSQFIDTSTVDKLFSKGELLRTLKKGSQLLYLPEISYKNDIIKEYHSHDSILGVEVLRVFKTSNKLDFDDEKTVLKLYNSLLSISRLKGLKYFSQTRQKERTLFYDSYVVDPETKSRKLKDPILKKPIPEKKIFIFQDDSTFRKNSYSVLYHYTKTGFVIKIENVTTMSYLFVPLIKPRDMITYMVIIPGKNSILFYGLSFAHFNAFPTLAERNLMSFYYRLIAMYNWFIKQLD